MGQEAEKIKNFIDLYHDCDNNAKYYGKELIFKLTTKSSQALTELTRPNSERDFRELVENLYIIVIDGSGNGQRLPLKLDDGKIVQKLKLLRNHYVHDQEHGNRSSIRRKYRQIGDIFQELIGTRVPNTTELWECVGQELINRLNSFMKSLISKFENYEEYYQITESKITYYYEHEITKFPDERLPYITIMKKKHLVNLADAPIFIPHFSHHWLPEFGHGTKKAVHFSSRAYLASLEDYKKFLDKIESLWTKKISYIAKNTQDFFVWSISSDGQLKYGSGFTNLLKAIEDTEIGIVSIFLIGCYGEDYSKTFFVVISNYWKNGMFRDNILDLYLSNIPLDYSWIEELNESMKILSDNNNIANSYSLKPYIYRFWRSKIQKNEIKDKIIGGIGRDGFNDDRSWDQFTGIILDNPFSREEFELEEIDTNFETSKNNIECPVEAFDKIVMSITNRPPHVEEILSGKLFGVVRPTIQEIILDGYGHSIHAILFWGVSLIE